MAIERELGAFPYAGRNAWAKADVRDEMPVHDVKMDKSGTAVFDGLKTVAKFEEVRVQDAGSDDLFKHVENVAKYLEI